MSSQQQSEALVAAARDGVIVVDDSRTFVDVNPAACRLLGASASELIGRRFDDFIERSADLEAAWKIFLRSGEQAGEVRVIRPDGTVALIEQVIPGAGKLVEGYVHQRTVAEYTNAFEGGGFKVSLSRPIRAPWRIASAAVRRPVPAIGLRVLAEATLMRAQSLSENAPYLDQLMIFRRSVGR